MTSDIASPEIASPPIASQSVSIAPPPAAKARWRLSFGLAHLLTLMAGFSIGLALMQPWKTWVGSPLPIDYHAAVVSVAPADLAADPSAVEKELAALYGPLISGPSKSGPEKSGAGDKATLQTSLLATATLAAIENETSSLLAKMPTTSDSPDTSKQGKSAAKEFAIEITPSSARGRFRVDITAYLSWKKAAPKVKKSLTQALGETKVIPLGPMPGGDSSGEGASEAPAQIYLVLTPLSGASRQFIPTAVSEFNAEKDR